MARDMGTACAGPPGSTDPSMREGFNGAVLSASATPPSREGLGTARLSFSSHNGPVDDLIDRLMGEAGGIGHPELVREMILAALKAGQESIDRADLKLMLTTLKEMRFTAKVFGPYRQVRKVSVFGSARVHRESPTCAMARLLGRELARLGCMVITGGGQGIMEAVNEGAGPDHSFGVCIRLPFEKQPNQVLAGSPRSITYKYFFNRKVAFIKETDAVAVFPGGFGTLDETVEIITLLQTGKRTPIPLILMDEPGGAYWERWVEFLRSEPVLKGYIGHGDFALFELVRSVDEAVEIIRRFYSRYHSMRFVGERLVIRLVEPLDDRAIDRLRTEFADLLVQGGEMMRTESLDEERDEQALVHLPRLVLDFNRREFGRLRQLIDAINAA